MAEDAWLTCPEVPARDIVRRSWAATVAALPVGTAITGEVIGRLRINGAERCGAGGDHGDVARDGRACPRSLCQGGTPTSAR